MRKIILSILVLISLAAQSQQKEHFGKYRIDSLYMTLAQMGLDTTNFKITVSRVSDGKQFKMYWPTGGTTPTLQQVTDAGNHTTDSIYAGNYYSSSGSYVTNVGEFRGTPSGYDYGDYKLQIVGNSFLLGHTDGIDFTFGSPSDSSSRGTGNVFYDGNSISPAYGHLRQKDQLGVYHTLAWIDDIGGGGGGGDMYKADNLSGLTNTATARTNIGLGSVENTALSTWAGTSNITTVGTIGTGTWHGGVISPQYGGTGVNNGVSSITLGGPLVTSGASTITLTSTATTNVTLPTTGTLSTLAGTETLTNKTIALSTNSVEGTYVNTQVLTTGTTYTSGAGVTKVKIRMVGGGGGGGGVTAAASSVGAGGGGGSGGYLEAVLTVTPSTGYTIAIGAAGTAGANTGAQGGAGGNTTITIGGSTYTAFGGGGGAGQATGTTVAASAGGTAAIVSTNGNILNSGGDAGSPGIRISGTSGLSGAGGTSKLGGGGSSLSAAGAGSNATGYGGGGGGGLSTANTARAGGAGTAGVIIIEEYK
jgi:hypothetical protein